MNAFDRIIGQSPAMQRLRDLGRRAALVDAPVLLTGETGTGKGLFARAIHLESSRARAAYVPVNCAGVPASLFETEFFGHTRGAFTGAQHTHRGLFEQAHGGTLFLDEIGDLAPTLQAKLLTALEDGEVRRVGGERAVRFDTRIIAATGVDLDRAVDNGRFRRDLLHRILVLPIPLPPLRERDDDLHLLLQHFLDHYRQRYDRTIRGLDNAARARLESHTWPGNIRELDHVIHAAVLACDGGLIRLKHLPHTLTNHTPPHPATAEPAASRRYAFLGSPAEEKRHLLDALRRCHGNKTRAARTLGMARNTLRHKLRTLGIHDRNQPD